MKPILFATNYSEAAENAGDYAAQLARLCNVRLIVLHTWTLPVLSAQDVVAAPSPEHFHERELLAINKEIARLRETWDVQVTGVECQGYTPEEIGKLYNQEEISLVVMGMSHHNFWSRFLGSVATTSIHKGGYPVLLIPDKIQFQKPESILFAADKDFSSYSKSLTPLKLFVRTMNTTLELVQVAAPEDIWNVDENDCVLNLEFQFRRIPHQWNINHRNDVADGILQTAETLHADWIAVTPRHFIWLESLFTRSVTEKLAFTTNKPLLILPAEEKSGHTKPQPNQINFSV